MENRSVTRTKLAQQMGVSRTYVTLLFDPERFFGDKAARKVERALGMPERYLEKDGQENDSMAIEAWDKPEDLADGVYAMVPRVEIRLSAGSGLMNRQETGLPPLAFRREWLSKKNVTARSNLFVCEVSGDSMSPGLQDGDIVLIDTGQNTLTDGEVYAIRYGDEVRIKRLFRRIDGSIRVISDNSAFPEEVITPADRDHFSILGLKIWRGG
jgi:phage repressor protein C with HTH and peptisase S24 domain